MSKVCSTAVVFMHILGVRHYTAAHQDHCAERGNSDSIGSGADAMSGSEDTITDRNKGVFKSCDFLKECIFWDWDTTPRLIKTNALWQKENSGSEKTSS